MDRNRVIGIKNRLPWRLPADMKRFRSTTMGKAVIMGRRTYESIGQPLTGRHNIVLTTNRAYRASGCTVVYSIEEALAVARGDEVIVIGGSALYRQMMPMVERIYLTIVDADFDGDSYFPKLVESEWVELSREDYLPDDKNVYRYSFILLERI